MDFLTDFMEGVQDFRVVGDPLALSMVFLNSTSLRVWLSCLGFKFLCCYVWFLQIQSHINI